MGNLVGIIGQNLSPKFICFKKLDVSKYINLLNSGSVMKAVTTMPVI